MKFSFSLPILRDTTQRDPYRQTFELARIGEEAGFEPVVAFSGFGALRGIIGRWRQMLYADPPLVKMLILGDYLWLQHYHADFDVRTMPEYVLRHNRQHYGLYSLYAHYFAQRWQSTEIPQYDLDNDELVYRDTVGGEMRREQF